jgi:hypothetical protein
VAPWDRLCDQLNGRGVTSLEDALVGLELKPVHDALRRQLDDGLVRALAGLAEHPRVLVTGSAPKTEEHRAEFNVEAWKRCQEFLRAAQKAYASRLAQQGLPAPAAPADNTAHLAESFRGCLRAAMRIPTIEAAFPAPWPAAARRVLPSPSPHLTATAMWGPLLAWCVLELLAESIDPDNKAACALDLFDRLRLREPLAHAFASLGFEGEESWRVSARIKVLLMSAAGVGKAEPASAAQEPAADHAHGKQRQKIAEQDEQVAERDEEIQDEKIPDQDEVPADELPEAAVGEPEFEPVPAKPTLPTTPAQDPAGEGNSPIAPGLWSDPDVRWLAGVHEADGHSYLIREPYEELLWWLLLPRLLTMAGAPTLDRAEVKTISASLQAALAAAEAAGYRIDLLIGQPDEDQPDEDLPAESAAKPASTETPEGKTAKTETSAEPEPATEVHKV